MDGHKTGITFITEENERNILGNDNLPKMGVEITPMAFLLLNQKR